MQLLIDGDVLVYQISNVIEEYNDWEEQELITVTANKQRGRILMDDLIRDLTVTVGACGYKVALTQDSSKNFRKEIWSDYKGNRSSVRRPVAFYYLRRYLLEAHNALQEERLEADDILSLLATSESILDPVIVSIDKDFKTIPCKIINPDKLELGLQEITPAEARRNFFIQVLEGDRADGYPGCKGYGGVLARRALEDTHTSKEMWDRVVECYKSKGLKEKDAILNARMAWLLQGDDYNFKTKEIKIWNPTRIY